ncbi:apoptosis facilitator Bcl-2-like protein 14 [Trichomycterus rosablanca]|uniref:apoptosis facilitator Bcl-2-like protein 14 n=1 Tax=Trichomycterus rosablanca TaxID=2290929 RepID=UPI002F3540FC
METNMSPKESFITELQLLETYHCMRKSKTRAKPQNKVTNTGVLFKKIVVTPQGPASAGTGTTSSVVDELTRIVDRVPAAQDEVQTDSDTDLIQRLVDLLKESGDKLNEKIQRDKELLGYLENCFSYNLFETLTAAFICKVVPAREQAEETTEQKRKIAWTFEMTSRLSALDLQPMNRVMGFGAQYVHQHFTPWIQQHGGWENTFNSNENDDML